MTAPRSRSARRPISLRASGDRWLFGYADIVTLMFACFASLYAAKVEPAPALVAPLPAVSPALPPTPLAAPDVDEAALERDLADLLSPDPSRPAIDISTSTRGVVISLPETGSFPAGRADFTPAARTIMAKIAEAVRALPNVIRVEGHTDDVPIHTAQFASNWELSTARATRVVQWLIEQGGLSAERLSAAGYGEFHPRVANDTAASRARNRRVDIVIVDAATAEREEPAIR